MALSKKCHRLKSLLNKAKKKESELRVNLDKAHRVIQFINIEKETAT